MTIPRTWPDELSDVWGKSADKGAAGQPETLAVHTWRVLEKLAETIRLRPSLPMQVGVPRLWHVLFWATFLHDFGKAAQGFQNCLRPGGARWAHRHEVLSLAFIDWIAAAFTQEELCWVAAAIASHHRDEEEVQQLYNLIGDPDESMLNGLVAELDERTLRHLWGWLSLCPSDWISALSLDAASIQVPTLPAQDVAVRVALESGPASIRKWLKRYRRWLERTINQCDEQSVLVGTMVLRGHLISSDHMASAHTGDLPASQLIDPLALVQRLQLPRLYDHQRGAMTVRGSAILMAPTGSGKTEAALLWAVSQAQSGQPVPRLYYALPFQASMNAMEQRLGKDDGERKAPFPGQVGLEHSRSTLAYYRRLLEEQYSHEKAVRAARRSNNLARLNYYPVRVLSPYQLLKAPYRLVGYETLLTDCFGAAFVFDEIHAYEADRLARILAMVKYLRERYEAKFFVMSATLPRLLRDRLSDALGSYTLLQASPALYEQFRRHILHLKDGDVLSEEAMDHIAEVAESGQSVLVCCNTVSRAQMAYEMLNQRLGKRVEVLLLHGRFNGKDRLKKEQTVRDATGSRSQARRPIVLVATQVVEVSLDIDLDVIYTDPAPLEALLQRFGRINRRRLKTAAPVYVYREPVPDAKRPYDPLLTRASLSVLEKHKDQLIDEAQTTDWLDEIYENQDISMAWNAEYQKAYADFCESTLASLRAFQSNPELEKLFYRAFDSIDVLPMGLSDQYEVAVQGNPLEASQLLVSLRWGQYAMLKNKGLVRESDDHRLREVNAYYDSDAGLDLKRTYNDLGDDF
jgi:CRISPR-associated endonuclease/helicase Cas3